MNKLSRALSDPRSSADEEAVDGSDDRDIRSKKKMFVNIFGKVDCENV